MSSATTTDWPVRTGLAWTGREGRVPGSEGEGKAHGTRTLVVVPSPGLLSNSMYPPSRSSSSQMMASLDPGPTEFREVIPAEVSDTSSSIQ